MDSQPVICADPSQVLAKGRLSVRSSSASGSGSDAVVLRLEILPRYAQRACD